MGALTKYQIDSASDSIAITDGGGSITVDGTVSIGSQAFVYAEDSAHTTADDGAFVLAVRADTAASTAGTDGDYSGLITNATGNLYVTDEAAQTSLATIAGDTTSLDALITALSKAEDAAHVTGDTGFQMLAVRNDVEGPLSSTDGDYSPLQVDASGRLRVIGDLDVVGNVADDAADAGAPLKVGSRAFDGTAVLDELDDGDRADMLSDSYRRVWMTNAPNVGLSSATVPVDDTAGGVNLAPTPQSGRQAMIIQNTSSSEDLYIGATGVTSATGTIIPKKGQLTLEVGEAVDVFGITGSASASDIRVFQIG